MKIKRIYLKNCIGLIKGSDIEELDIDFEDINPSVIGIFGKSGTGKSTLLNNLNPFRDDFKHNFYDDGIREVEFEFKGFHYHSKIYHTKALLFKDGELLNPSEKVSEYDEELQNEIGDKDTFFQLLYAGRRFSNILDLTKGERKQLIVDYLLDYLKDYDTYQINMKQEQSKILDEIRRYEIKIEDKAKFEPQLEENKLKITELKVEIDEKVKEEKQLQNLQTLYQKQEEENKKIKEKIEQYNERLKEYKEELESINEDKEQEEEKLSKLRIKYQNEKEKIKEIQKPKNSLKQEQLLKHDYSIILNGKQEKLSDIKSEISRLKNDIERKKDKKEELETKIKTLDVPCSSDLQMKCTLTKFKSFTDLKKEYESEIKDSDKDVEIKQIELNSKEKELETIKLNIEDIKEKIKACDDEIVKIMEYDKLEEVKKRVEEIKKLGKEQKSVVEKLKLKYENQIKKIEKFKESKPQKEIDNEYEDKSNDIKGISDKISDLKGKLSYTEFEIESLEEKMVEINQMEELIDKKRINADEYNILIEFFGKNGGQIFDIEQAGKEISKVANKLLENYENKKIKVKFDTLKENSKGEIKEVFDINCSINDAEWQTYLSDGESVLVSNSIREAMSYLKKTKDFKTVFIDELDGSIDSEARIGFIRLLEEGNRLNERQFTFLITHSEEVKSYLEKNIIFQNNNLTINL
jgi:DNA repair exonuclease SbcCD ATPase subunit